MKIQYTIFLIFIFSVSEQLKSSVPAWGFGLGYGDKNVSFNIDFITEKQPMVNLLAGYNVFHVGAHIFGRNVDHTYDFSRDRFTEHKNLTHSYESIWGGVGKFLPIKDGGISLAMGLSQQTKYLKREDIYGILGDNGIYFIDEGSETKFTLILGAYYSDSYLRLMGINKISLNYITFPGVISFSILF